MLDFFLAGIIPALNVNYTAGVSTNSQSQFTWLTQRDLWSVVDTMLAVRHTGTYLAVNVA